MVGQRGATLLALMVVGAVGSWGCHRSVTAPFHRSRALGDHDGRSAAPTSAARSVAPLESTLRPAAEPAPGSVPEPTPAPLPPPVVQSVYLEVGADDSLEVELGDSAR